MKDKKRAMGRGLGAILSAETKANIHHATDSGADQFVGSIVEIPLEDIVPNPTQPRTHFDEEALENLSQSIKSLGIIQPLTLRKVGDKFEIISGERRYRASKLAGLITVPAYIRLVNDQELLEMALVENIQREDLDPIEIALTYQRLLKEIGHTQEHLSQRLGKKRSTITNSIRLLNLPPEIQSDIRMGEISAGHGRAILAAADEASALRIWKLIKEKSLSVRQAEELAKQSKSQTSEKQPTKEVEIPNQIKKWQHTLENRFGSSVHFKVNASGKKGKLIFDFKNLEELENILQNFEE